jgi:hypothetical protein
VSALSITSIVEIVRPAGGGALDMRVRGGTFDCDEAEQHAESMAARILGGRPCPPGVEAVLVVRDGVLVAQWPLAALEDLCGLLWLLEALADVPAQEAA